ncbi:DUF3040 domain-containing protein [Motilibacter aurantiacus]|uniref:DUF3040 domain-containing protein n=1 Tax=Motilibacter aurantiacus TaxID=2714955 RepID=UPI001407FD4C|nr:DUF3040 domain-containing protein [Motilibacter aurantiacus]
MPLSEHEQRLLEQMERALYAEDPKFASSLRGSDLRVLHRRRVVKAGAGFLVGIGLLLAGVITPLIPLGVFGAVVMIASALLAVHSWRQLPSPDAANAPGRSGPRPARRQQGGRRFMDRVEERWNRRREDDGR